MATAGNTWSSAVTATIHGRRITLVLDIKAAYQRLKAKGNWFFRSLTRGWPTTVHRRLAA